MAFKSAIEWTEATWNPWHGCHKVSQGCKNCYMFRDKKRYGQDPNVVVGSKTKFYDPLKWKEPRKIFTCSWSDFFIEEADAWRDEAMAIMALTPQHTYQVLTKRPDRMLDYLNSDQTPGRIATLAITLRKERRITFPNAEFNTEPLGYGDPGAEWYPLKNVWLGVSVEDQKTADERIPLLLRTPAALRWLSIEPLLGPVDLRSINRSSTQWLDAVTGLTGGRHSLADCSAVDWVIVGGESGPNARPMHPDWIRLIRDQCQAAGVPFFFKQWGEWWPIGQMPDGISDNFYGKQYPKPRRPEYDERPAPKAVESVVLQLDGTVEFAFPKGAMTCFKVGKAKAGRLLDGREWNEFPKIGQ